MLVARFMAHSSSWDSQKFKHLFVTDTRCQLLVAKTALTMWANLLLKHSNTVLAKIKDNISFKCFMDLQNSPLSGLLDLSDCLGLSSTTLLLAILAFPLLRVLLLWIV